MDATAKAQRRRERRKIAGSALIRIEMTDALGNQRHATAGIVDIIDGGLGLALTTAVKSGSIVVVRGKLADHYTADHVKAVVRWCNGKADGTFRAGLEFLDGLTSVRGSNSDAPDYYEVMQLSPNADANTISRVYRLLASQYHPDNSETGNSEMFLRLSEAYQILSDPVKRASYDARRRDATKVKLDHARGVAIDSRRGEGKGERFRRSVGALRGWETALQIGAGHQSRVWIG